MPPQARVGDNAFIPADAHGCPACPHPAAGPAVQGSRNVLTNGLPSVRVGDKGIHAACCGANLWNAKLGSATVLINGRRAHRAGDLTTHCGGSGITIVGSPNVIVGDNGGGKSAVPVADRGKDKAPVLIPPPVTESSTWLEIQFDGEGASPAGVRYEVTTATGQVLTGTLDTTGFARLEGLKPGTCKIRFPDLDEKDVTPT